MKQCRHWSDTAAVSDLGLHCLQITLYGLPYKNWLRELQYIIYFLINLHKL